MNIEIMNERSKFHRFPGTVKAQLLYEIASPAYLNPDVIGHFDTLRIEQAVVYNAYSRVKVTGSE